MTNLISHKTPHKCSTILLYADICMYIYINICTLYFFYKNKTIVLIILVLTGKKKSKRLLNALNIKHRIRFPNPCTFVVISLPPPTQPQHLITGSLHHSGFHRYSKHRWLTPMMLRQRKGSCNRAPSSLASPRALTLNTIKYRHAVSNRRVNTAEGSEF